MPFVPFHNHAPELAKQETRSTIQMENGEPVRTHLFTESFCNEAGCDCRRVYIQVISDEPGVAQPRATISWGWESDQFYCDWASFPLTRDDLAELRGPALVRLMTRSEEAEDLLAKFRMLLSDASYAARIVSHYETFRAGVPRAAATPSMNRAERRRAASGKKRR